MTVAGKATNQAAHWGHTGSSQCSSEGTNILTWGSGKALIQAAYPEHGSLI